MASAATTLFAAAAHTLGGGGAPTPAVLLVVMVLALPVALAFSGRRPSTVRTALAVVGAQAVYHAVFAVFGMSVAFTAPAMVHTHSVMASDAAAASMADSPVMSLFEPCMLAMHVSAAIVTLAVLVHGERLLRSIVGAIWPRAAPPRSLSARGSRLRAGDRSTGRARRAARTGRGAPARSAGLLLTTSPAAGASSCDRSRSIRMPAPAGPGRARTRLRARA